MSNGDGRSSIGPAEAAGPGSSFEALVRRDGAPAASEEYWKQLRHRLDDTVVADAEADLDQVVSVAIASAQPAEGSVSNNERPHRNRAGSGGVDGRQSWRVPAVAAAIALVVAGTALLVSRVDRSESQLIATEVVAPTSAQPALGEPVGERDGTPEGSAGEVAGLDGEGGLDAVAHGSSPGGVEVTCPENVPVDGLRVDLDADGVDEILETDDHLRHATEVTVVWHRVHGCRWERVGSVAAGPMRTDDASEHATRVMCATGRDRTRQLVMIRPAVDISSGQWSQLVVVHELIDGRLVSHAQSRVSAGSAPVDTFEGAVGDWCADWPDGTSRHESVVADVCGAAGYSATPPAGWHTMVVGEASCQLFDPDPWVVPCECDRRMHLWVEELSEDEAIGQAEQYGAAFETVQLGDHTLRRYEDLGLETLLYGESENFLHYVIPADGRPGRALLVSARYSAEWAERTNIPVGSYDDFVATVETFIESLSWRQTSAGVPSGATPSWTPAPAPEGALDTPPLMPTPRASANPDDPNGIRAATEAYQARWANRVEPMLMQLFNVDDEIPTLEESADWYAPAMARLGLDDGGLGGEAVTACWSDRLRARLRLGGFSPAAVDVVLAWPASEDDDGSAAWYSGVVEEAAIAALLDCVDHRVVGFTSAQVMTQSVSLYGPADLPDLSPANPCFGFDDLSDRQWSGEGELLAQDLVGRRAGRVEDRPARSRVESCNQAVRLVSSGPIRDWCVAPGATVVDRRVLRRPQAEGDVIATVEPDVCGLRAASDPGDVVGPVRSLDGWSPVLLPDADNTIGWIRSAVLLPAYADRPDREVTATNWQNCSAADAQRPRSAVVSSAAAVDLESDVDGDGAIDRVRIDALDDGSGWIEVTYSTGEMTYGRVPILEVVRGSMSNGLGVVELHHDSGDRHAELVLETTRAASGVNLTVFALDGCVWRPVTEVNQGASGARSWSWTCFVDASDRIELVRIVNRLDTREVSATHMQLGIHGGEPVVVRVEVGPMQDAPYGTWSDSCPMRRGSALGW